MRIIAGTFRGRRLKTPPSSQARPTSDRLRETLFNVLTPRIEDALFLDLCAGTGAVGIEALSRGAAQLTLVDQSRRMCALIESNLDGLRIDPAKYEVVTADAPEFLRRRVRRQSAPFDVVFFDPPYGGDYETVLTFISQHLPAILTTEGLVVVEHYKKKAVSESFGELTRYRELKQGDSVLSFYHVVSAR